MNTEYSQHEHVVGLYLFLSLKLQTLALRCDQVELILQVIGLPVPPSYCQLRGLAELVHKAAMLRSLGNGG
jgi:hypothetical protein